MAYIVFCLILRHAGNMKYIRWRDGYETPRYTKHNKGWKVWIPEYADKTGYEISGLRHKSHLPRI